MDTFKLRLPLRDRSVKNLQRVYLSRVHNVMVLVQNMYTGKYINDINNLGVRAQLLFEPTDNTSITLAAGCICQRPDGYAQVVAGVVETKRAAYRQFNSIIA